MTGDAIDPRHDRDSSAVAPLPRGHRLHEFEIEHVLGEGGFGIVYLARDLQLHRTVALKEYMPASLAVRQADDAVAVRSQRHQETFDLGLRSFVNEARLLASFDNASLVKVYRFWEQNGTAYMVMPFYEGPTLKAWLKEQPQPPDEAWLKRLLGPLLDALALIHADHCYHRDIAPDNILLLGADQRPLLLDFGAARRVIGDATQALTVILKPGYAPIEQYADVPAMKQGPWTDVYALCAVLYMAISGRAPTAAVGRMMNDDLVPLASSARGRYAPAFLAAIDAGLAVRPEQRPPDIVALRARLFAPPLPADDGNATVMRAIDPEATVFMAPQPSAEPMRPVGTERFGLAAAVDEPSAPAPAPAGPPSRRGVALLLVGLTGLAVTGGAAWYLTRSGPRPAQEIARPAPAASPARAAPAPVPAVEARSTRAAFGPVAALEDIVRHGDPLISVNTIADKERIVIGTDRMQFRVKASEAGHLYVFLAGTDQAHLQLLFPNALDQNNRIAADTLVTLPRKGWQITAGGPAGVNHIVTMVSRDARDFVAAGIKAGESIPEFDLAALQRAWTDAAGAATPWFGEPRCAATDGRACDGRFGASMIQIEEVAGK